MEGGQKTKTVMPDIPENVVRFRSIVNHFKQNVYKATESYKSENVQDLNNLNQVIHRIKQFGRLINMCLENIKHPSTNSVYNFFYRNNIDLKALTEKEKDACRYYTYIDIFTYPYDLNPNHINSQSKIEHA